MPLNNWTSRAIYTFRWRPLKVRNGSIPTVRTTRSGCGGGRQTKGPRPVNHYVGQGVGLIEDVRSCRAVVQDFITKSAEALEDLQALSGGLQRSSGLMAGSRS
jgi:hypothetical protein